MTSSKPKKPARLSDNMREVLRGIVAGKGTHHGCEGRSMYGARIQTLWALRTRGLLDRDNEPTDAGRALFAPPPPIP